ncbi:MAG: hypothetical protein JO112_06870 [Planctomycetes bacterium]|nr:hypothetical protein [Planctomycetota bacterium]
MIMENAPPEIKSFFSVSPWKPNAVSHAAPLVDGGDGNLCYNNPMSTTSVDHVPHSPDLADLIGAVTDPVERLLLTGRAKTVYEAEEKYLDSAYPQVLTLLASPLSNEELGRHPLFVLYRSHGSRPREDSLL